MPDRASATGRDRRRRRVLAGGNTEIAAWNVCPQRARESTRTPPPPTAGHRRGVGPGARSPNFPPPPCDAIHPNSNLPPESRDRFDLRPAPLSDLHGGLVVEREPRVGVHAEVGTPVRGFQRGVMERTHPCTEKVYEIESTKGQLTLTLAGSNEVFRFAVLSGQVRLISEKRGGGPVQLQRKTLGRHPVSSGRIHPRFVARCLRRHLPAIRPSTRPRASPVVAGCIRVPADPGAPGPGATPPGSRLRRSGTRGVRIRYTVRDPGGESVSPRPRWTINALQSA